MDEQLRKLAEKPLDEGSRCGKIWLPEGRRAATREGRPPYTPNPNDLTLEQVKERRAKALTEKRAKLLDYYAGTDLSAEKVTEYLGVTHLVQVGTDPEDQFKPVYERQPDVEWVRKELQARRAR